ncbi:alpha/beta hydrolase [Pedobacter polaris]|uniref:Alpha/beta hydrolase n=1 Tax=Pedobacter polaris TaxID=2571273 RepID=A0A4U1CIV8_9SPHI|nr:alpha/beta hydrolase [Pedobacter polaris]TKC04758.1 alpha/beta hydrolase [Pedobacter polaris]
MKSCSKFIILSVVVLMLLAGCEKSTAPSYKIEAEAKTLLDVAYGTESKQKMDVYLPANRTSNTGIIIFVHGGSFIGGDKADIQSQAKYLAGSGYAVLNVNYRLVDGTGLMQTNPARIESAIKVKDQITDMNTIIDYAIAHAKEWVVNADRIVMVGHSAGGSLALLYSYDKRNTKVKAVSNLAGAIDLVFSNIPNWQFLPPALLEAGYRFTGFEVALENEQYYKNISALSVANTTQKIPTLNVFPQNNNVQGLPRQDIVTYHTFTAKLNELKVPNEFYFVEGSDHYFSQNGKWQLVLAKSISFFNTTLD